jgi:hypothetical protein
MLIAKTYGLRHIKMYKKSDYFIETVFIDVFTTLKY